MATTRSPSAPSAGSRSSPDGQPAAVTAAAAAVALLFCSFVRLIAQTTIYNSGDSQRLITTDPAAGSGVLLDAALEAGQVLLLPPGCTYLNAEEPGAALLEALLRRHQGTAEAVVVSVQLRAMVLAL